MSIRETKILKLKKKNGQRTRTGILHGWFHSDKVVKTLGDVQNKIKMQYYFLFIKIAYMKISDKTK